MKNYTRILASITLLLLAFGTTVAHASAPSGTISVTPNTGLADGQSVQVSGSGFQKNLALAIIECGPIQPFPLKGGWQSATCTYYSVAVTTDADGNFAAQDFTVSSVIQGAYWTHGHNVPATYDCLVRNDCHIHVYSTVSGNTSVNQDLLFS